MESFTRSWHRHSRRATRRGLHVEVLEGRAVLAAAVGNVTAQLVGSTLLLTGDALPNQVVVASVTGGKIAVLGNNTTVNGSGSPFVTTRPVTSIIANLNGGDDMIGFGNSAQGFADQLSEQGFFPPFNVSALQSAITTVANGATTFSLPGSLTITTADGSDFVSMIGNVGGSVVANLGSAPSPLYNAIMIGGFEPAYASRVGGGVSVVGGAQGDYVELAGTTVGRGVSTFLGDGENGLGIYESSVASVAYTGGAGQDGIDTAALRVRNGVTITTGAGEDSVYLHEHGGPSTTIGGSVIINTGADGDYVEINSVIGGGLSIVTGVGDDEVAVLNSSVGLNALINTGDGNDAVGVISARVRYNLFVALGAGNDGLTVVNTTALAAFLYGGPGTNQLGIDAASRAGIRRLFYTQFQTVVVPT